MESKFKVGDRVYFMHLDMICCSKVKNVEWWTEGGESFYAYDLEQMEVHRFEEYQLFESLDAILGHLVQNIMVASKQKK